MSEASMPHCGDEGGAVDCVRLRGWPKDDQLYVRRLLAKANLAGEVYARLRCVDAVKKVVEGLSGAERDGAILALSELLGE